MKKTFTKNEVKSINVFSEKTSANKSTLDNIICELYMMHLVLPFVEEINIFTSYTLAEDNTLEKWIGTRLSEYYVNIKEYTRKATQEEKNIILELMNLDNCNEIDNYDKAEELIRKFEGNEFFFDKNIIETGKQLFNDYIDDVETI